jgi:hypothetical protein
MRRIGLGIDAATAVAAAILPGGLPALGAYELWKKLTGSAGPAVDTIEGMNMISMQVQYLQAQIGLALNSCPPDVIVGFTQPITDAMAAVSNAQQVFNATVETERSTAPAPAANVKELLAAVASLQGVADKMTALAGCTTQPVIARWLCDDGTLAPGGDRKQCGTDWKKLALWGALGVGGVVAAVVVYKAVSD